MCHRTKQINFMTFPAPNPAKRPTTENVDYFQFDFDMLDLHACWRKATHTGKHKNYYTAVQGKRYLVVLID